MPGLKTKEFGTGDRRWLGSTHGLYNARSAPLDVTSLTEADHYPDGYIVSGIPLAKDGDLYVPWDGDASDGTEVLEGFLVEDQPINGDDVQNVALLDHGRIKVKFVPVEFDPTDIETTGQFIWDGSQDGGS